MPSSNLVINGSTRIDPFSCGSGVGTQRRRKFARVKRYGPVGRWQNHHGKQMAVIRCCAPHHVVLKCFCMMIRTAPPGDFFCYEIIRHSPLSVQKHVMGGAELCLCQPLARLSPLSVVSFLSPHLPHPSRLQPASVQSHEGDCSSPLHGWLQARPRLQPSLKGQPLQPQFPNLNL